MPVPDEEETPAAWWTGYFDDDYVRVYEPLLPQEQTEREADAIHEILGDRPGARVLDAGCGWGRHAIELASRGFHVTGVDLSENMLAEAARRARDANVPVTLVRVDMKDPGFADEFDVALSLFSSLGYADENADLATLAGIRRSLRRDGRFILQVMHRDSVARDFAERDWWELPDGGVVRVERRFDAVAGVSHEILRWRDAAGAEGEKRHSIRVRTATEWGALLERAGFHPTEWYGDWDLEPFHLGSDELIVVC